MTNDTEQQLVRKVDRIYDALIGIEGQEEEGLLARFRSHDERIGRLERLRWYVAGVVAAVMFYFGLRKP